MLTKNRNIQSGNLENTKCKVEPIIKIAKKKRKTTSQQIETRTSIFAHHITTTKHTQLMRDTMLVRKKRHKTTDTKSITPKPIRKEND